MSLPATPCICRSSAHSLALPAVDVGLLPHPRPRERAKAQRRSSGRGASHAREAGGRLKSRLKALLGHNVHLRRHDTRPAQAVWWRRQPPWGVVSIARSRGNLRQPLDNAVCFTVLFLLIISTCVFAHCGTPRITCWPLLAGQNRRPRWQASQPLASFTRFGATVREAARVLSPLMALDCFGGSPLMS